MKILLILALTVLTFGRAFGEGAATALSASQAEVTAGQVGNKYVSPKTLATALAGVGSPTNGVTATTATNIALVQAQTVVATNLAKAVANGAVNGTTQTNVSLVSVTNNLAPNPYAAAVVGANELTVLLATTNGGGGYVPLVTAGQDYGMPNLDGTITTWGYGNLGAAQVRNAGRYFGNDWNWQLAAPGQDTRTFIMHGFSGGTTNKGAGMIFEVFAGKYSAGTHGRFANTMLFQTNGTIALGNLTDTADSNPLSLCPPAWVTIYGDHSKWSTGGSQLGATDLAQFNIQPQGLVWAPAPGTFEFDNTNFWGTDGQSNRYAMLWGLGGNNASLLTNPTTLGNLGTWSLVSSNIVAQMIALYGGVCVFSGLQGVPPMVSLTNTDGTVTFTTTGTNVTGGVTNLTVAVSSTPVLWNYNLGTNLAVAFNSMLQTYTLPATNVVGFASFSGTSGSCSYRMTNTVVAYPATVAWLTAHPAKVTNGVVSFTAYGSAVTAAYKETQ